MATPKRKAAAQGGDDAAPRRAAGRKAPPRANGGQTQAPVDKGGSATVVPMPQLVQRFLREISASSQVKDDAATAHASVYKRAKDHGLNTEALKLTRKLVRQDFEKTRIFIDDVINYMMAANLLQAADLTWVQGDMLRDHVPVA